MTTNDCMTIGLINSLKAIALVLQQRLDAEAERMKRSPEQLEWFSEDVQIALASLSGDTNLRGLVFQRDDGFKSQTQAEADARDAARYRAMRDAYLSGNRYQMGIWRKHSTNGMMFYSVTKEAEYDRVVDDQMSGLRPGTTERL